MGAGKVSGDALYKTWSQSRRLLYTVQSQEAKTEIPDGTLFGRVANVDCGLGGICAGVAAINSFIYLENRFPNIYDNHLTPNRNPITDPQGANDTTDAKQFAGCPACGVMGWQDLANPLPGHNDDSPAAPQDDVGYYLRPGGAISDYIQPHQSED